MSRILDGDTERIQTHPLKDGSLAAVTGSSTIVIAIQRVSDGFWYDFNDDTFKSSGWTTRQETMTEVSATYAPGEYCYDFDTSVVTNAAADDSYMVHVDDTSATAVNVPQTGEIKVDQWPAAILDDTSAIDARLPSDPADESLQQAAHSQTQADIAALNDLDQADVQAALTAQGYTTARAPNLDNADTTVSSRAAPGDAMDLVTDAVDAAALATDAVDEIRDAILADSTPFNGADIDVSISSRAAPGDAMTLTGAQLAALVDAVWDEDVVAAHGTADTAGLLLRVLGALISQRINNATLHALLGVPDAAGEDISTVVDAELTAQHGSGAWDGTDSDWTTTEREQIRGALGIVGTQATPAGGGDLQDILADTDAIDTRLPSDPADESLQQAAHATTQAAVAALNDLSASDVDAQLSGTHGAGSWEDAGTGGWTSVEREQIRSALGVDGDKTDATGGDLQDVKDRLG